MYFRNKPAGYFFGIVLLLIYTQISHAVEKKLYKIDSQNSFISFSTIKKQYIVEKAFFSSIKGDINDSGKVSIFIDTTSINTGHVLRDKRLNSGFFKKSIYSKIKVSADIPISFINAVVNYRKKKLPITINFAKNEQQEEVYFMLSKTPAGYIVASSINPIIININQYGVPMFIFNTFSKAINHGKISSIMAFNFVLTFKKAKKH